MDTESANSTSEVEEIQPPDETHVTKFARLFAYALAIFCIGFGVTLVSAGDLFDTSMANRPDPAFARNGSLRQAIGVFALEHRRLPNSLDELTVEVEINGKVYGPYLEDPMALRDPWGRPYRYTFPAEKSNELFDIWSVGPNGIDGDDDDITNW